MGTRPSYSRTRRNVGDRTRSCTPRARAAPWTRVVFPAPRSPVSDTTSPDRSRPASASPSARVSSGEAVARSSPVAPTERSEQPELLFGTGSDRNGLLEDLPDRPEIRTQRRHLRAGLAPAVQDSRGVKRGHDRSPLDREALTSH